jgi:hypothetical protein
VRAAKLTLPGPMHLFTSESYARRNLCSCTAVFWGAGAARLTPVAIETLIIESGGGAATAAAATGMGSANNSTRGTTGTVISERWHPRRRGRRALASRQAASQLCLPGSCCTDTAQHIVASTSARDPSVHTCACSAARMGTWRATALTRRQAAGGDPVTRL